MRPPLAARANPQHGVFTCAQALGAGYSRQDVRTLARRGDWVRVRRGAYVAADRWRFADTHGRHLLTVRAALLAVADDSVVSHDSAAVAHSLPTWELDLSSVHLTRPGARTSRREAGVVHHLAELPPGQLAVVDDVAVTGPARTALDVARTRGFEVGLVCADAALHAGAAPAALPAAAERDRTAGPLRHQTAVAQAADGRRESPGETLTAVLLGSAGLEVEPQFVLPGLAYRADFRVRGTDVLVEFDGRTKYVATDPEEQRRVLWDEKVREDQIRERGYEFVGIYWEDLFGARRARTEHRVRMALDRARRPRRKAG